MKISRECFIIPQAVKKPTKTRASTSSRSMQKRNRKKGGIIKKNFLSLRGKREMGRKLGG
jgi:DNA topoisomerase IB